MIDETDRCEYSKCRAALPPPGPQGGRRRSFCRETRWAGGRSCAQMARAERDALDALGLDAGRSAFRLDADRLREQVDAVLAPVAALATALAAVTSRLDEVEGGALAAVEAAHRGTADAESARVEAQRAAERADRESRKAHEQAERAVRERSAAVERAAAAARQALDATEALGAARQVAEDAGAARRAAEERAAAAERRAAEAGRAAHESAVAAGRADTERSAALARAAEWRAENAKLRIDLDGLRSDLSVAAAARDEAVGRAASTVDELRAERELRRHTEQELAGARERVQSEVALRGRAEAELDRLRTELDGARADARQAHADARGARSELAGLDRAERPSGDPAGG